MPHGTKSSLWLPTLQIDIQNVERTGGSCGSSEVRGEFYTWKSHDYLSDEQADAYPCPKVRRVLLVNGRNEVYSILMVPDPGTALYFEMF